MSWREQTHTLPDGRRVRATYFMEAVEDLRRETRRSAAATPARAAAT